MSEERRASMAAYGAELISVPAGKMEMARDLAAEMAARGEGIVLDQFGNLNNPLAHYRGTGAAPMHAASEIRFFPGPKFKFRISNVQCLYFLA